MQMRLAMIAALLIAANGRAQMMMNPARMSASSKNFDPRPGEPQLKCEVTALRPALNFSLRFQAGYAARVPLAQYAGASHTWAVYTRITPDGSSQPVYMVDRLRLPEIPKTKAEAEFGGTYLIGEGRYHVDWKLLDDGGRVCRKQWNFEARPTKDQRRLNAAMPPGTVSEISLRSLRRAVRNPDDGPPFNLTILLHAAPLSPRRTRLGARDRIMLTGTLSALLERLPTRSVRIVAFSLDQQKELFRQENFGLQNLDRVARAINETEMGTVDYSILQNRRGHTELLARLLNEELNHQNPSDVVLVLGPTSRFFDKLPEGTLEKPANSGPRFFFLRYGLAFRVESVVADMIGMAISKLKGKTVMIRTPEDFVKAIELVERRAVNGS